MRITRWLTPVLVLGVLTGVVLAGWTLAIRSPGSPWYLPRWEVIDGGLERIEYVIEDRINIVLYKIDPEIFKLDLEYKSYPQSLETWANEITGEILVVNGVYFLEDYSPAGQFIVNGQSLGQQVFDVDKSGALTFEPVFGITPAIEPFWYEHDLKDAAQTYPWLLKNGRGSIKTDSGLLARRTFIGTDTDSQIYLGVVWKDSVSLFALMHAILEMEIDWGHVINLDGGPSTGVVVTTGGFSEVYNSAPVPNVIVIRRR